MASYVYLINVLYQCIIFVILYRRVPKIFHKGILINCTIISILGLFFQYYILYYDWAKVIGILGTRIGPEDFFFVLSFYGLTMTLNNKHLKKIIPLSAKRSWHKKHLINIIFLMYISLVVITYSLLGMQSFTASTIAMIPSLSIVYISTCLE